MPGIEIGARACHAWMASAAFAVGAIVYALLAGSLISRAFIDLGDGNYLYTSARMADGLQIYRDFLSPQPPLHLLVGSLLIRFGRLLGHPDAPLYTVRVFSLVLHICSAAWLHLLGRRLTRSPWGGALAALLFLFLPTGFWWSTGYQSEPLEIFWMLGALWFFLRFQSKSMALSGVLMGLAVLTNMTAAPYAVASLLYLMVRHGIERRTGGWRLALCFCLPLLAVAGGVAAFYEWRTGAYVQNVILNQVASYPKGEFWMYAWGKVTTHGGKVLVHEGGLILLALLGLMLYGRDDARPEREYLLWYALALLLSLLYVSKGGTADYIFTIGEPVVALFSVYFLTRFFSNGALCCFRSGLSWRDTSLLPRIAFCALAALVVGFFPVRFLAGVLREEQFEQSEEAFERVAVYIESYSKPGDTIVAPPYYAFATGRLLAEEYSELFLWTLKYSLEVEAMLLSEEDLLDPKALADAIGKRARPVDRFLAERLSPRAGASLAALAQEINGVLRAPVFWDPERFEGIEIDPKLRALAAGSPIGADLARLNRLLLEAAFPEAIRPCRAAREPDGEGVRTVKAITERLNRRAVPLVVANVSPANPQILRSAEIRSAVQRYYKPLVPDSQSELFRTASFQIQIFVPKTDKELESGAPAQ